MSNRLIKIEIFMMVLVLIAVALGACSKRYNATLSMAAGRVNQATYQETLKPEFRPLSRKQHECRKEALSPGAYEACNILR